MKSTVRIEAGKKKSKNVDGRRRKVSEEEKVICFPNSSIEDKLLVKGGNSVCLAWKKKGKKTFP